MQLLENPEHPKNISQISQEYGISRKVLYEWQKINAENGKRGFEPKPRKAYQRKFGQGELIDRICNLSLLHPDWSARKLIEHLRFEYGLEPSPSIPTVLKILHEQHLGSSKQRFSAAERSYLEGKMQLPLSAIDMLAKHNPFLKLLELNQRAKGGLFFLKVIPLSTYFGKAAGNLLLAVEAHSLLIFGKYWDGRSRSDLETFVTDVEFLGGGKYKARNYFVAEKRSAFARALKSWRSRLSPSEQIDFLSIDLEKSHFKVVTDVFRLVLNPFLKTYQFTNSQQFESDLNQLLTKHAISTKHLGYPCFGEEPHVVYKNYLENLYFEVEINAQY